MENNNFMHRFVADTIACMADRDYQIRVWARGEGPECDSFCESMNAFYDYMEIIYSEYKKYGLNDEDLNFLKNLEKKIDDFSEIAAQFDRDGDLINDLKWLEIVEISKEACERLKKYV